MDIVCSQLAFRPVTVAFVAVFVFCTPLIIRKCSTLTWQLLRDYTFIKDLVKISSVPLCVTLFTALVDTTCIVPNAKTAFKEDYKIPTIKCYVHRKTEMDHLMRLIQLTSDHPGGYFLLEGVHGSGKSTILQQSLLPYSESGIAHLYVQVGVDGDLIASLYSALKIKDYCDSTWAGIRSLMNLPSNACPDEPVARFKYALEVLELAAAEICQDDGVPPLVVFDNTAQILMQPDGVKIIHLLQDTAKDVSDKRYMLVLFASRESSVPNIMKSRSAISPLVHTLIIGDITDKEAVNYLTCRCPNATNDVIAKAVQLIGGRFIHLTIVANRLRFGEAGLAEYKSTLFKEIQTSMHRLPVNIRTVLIAVVQSILQSPTKMITVDDYETLVRELTQDDQNLIDITNIIEIRMPEGVFLASRVIETYFKEKLSNSTV